MKIKLLSLQGIAIFIGLAAGAYGVSLLATLRSPAYDVARMHVETSPSVVEKIGKVNSVSMALMPFSKFSSDREKGSAVYQIHADTETGKWKVEVRLRKQKGTWVVIGDTVHGYANSDDHG